MEPYRSIAGARSVQQLIQEFAASVRRQIDENALQAFLIKSTHSLARRARLDGLAPLARNV